MQVDEAEGSVMKQELDAALIKIEKLENENKKIKEENKKKCFMMSRKSTPQWLVVSIV